MKDIEYLKQIDVQKLCDEIKIEYPNIANKIASAFIELYSAINTSNQAYYNEQIGELYKYTFNNSSVETINEIQTDAGTIDSKNTSIDENFTAHDNTVLKHGHSLNEKFIGTKISQIKIRTHVMNCLHWNEGLVKVCEYLYNIHSRPIISLINKPINNKSNKRSKRWRFVYNKTDVKAGKLIPGTNIYVGTNDNPDGIVSCIKKLLDIYNIPLNQCTIYLKNDWKFPQLPENADELKIGELAQYYFDNMFKLPIPSEMIHNMLDKQWSHENLGITLPLIVETSNLAPDKSRRYYKKKRNINGVMYYLCSQWFEHDRSKLYNWVYTNTGANFKSVSDNEPKNYKENLDQNVCFGTIYNNLTIPASVLVCILKTMNENYQKHGEICIDKSLLNKKTYIDHHTNYKKPVYVINMIRNYLFYNHIIDYKPNYKKKHYIISNQQHFDALITNPWLVEKYDVFIPNNVQLYIKQNLNDQDCKTCHKPFKEIKGAYHDDKDNQTYQLLCQICPKCKRIFVNKDTYNKLKNTRGGL